MLALFKKGLKTFVYCLILATTPFVVSAQEAHQTDPNATATSEYINALCKDLIEKGKTTDKLTEKDLTDLPIGIARQIGGLTYIIAVDSARWTEHGWFFSAYTSITFPGTTTPLAFRASNIAFNESGLAGSSQVKLLLATTRQIAMNKNMAIRFPADGHNYVEFNCDGFKAVNFKGEFVFAKDFLEPDNTAAPNATEVTASFEVNTGDLNNIMTTVKLTPFKIARLRNLSIDVKDAVVDCSDLINPAGFSFPQNYQQQFGSDINLWHGFYLREVAIRFNGLNGDKTPPTVAAKNLIIDDMGVSGSFSAVNLISREEGSADGWPFSVDQLHLQLLLNKVKGGGLAGKITLPFLGDEPIAYTAMIEQGDSTMSYRFSIATPEDKVFNTPFAAKVQINKGSVISMATGNNGRLIPSALLHGNISFVSEEIVADHIEFKNLGITTRKPYVVSGEFATVSGSEDEAPSGMGFPLQIDSIRLRIYQGQIGFGFAVALNFMNAKDRGFAAATNIQILATAEERIKKIAIPGSEIQREEISQHWKLDRIAVDNITLDVTTQAFAIRGQLALYKNDPVYGNGFKGSLAFSIKKILEKGIKVTAYFGSKPTYRYWHVDAYVPTGSIPIVPPALFMNGIIGGASYHMARKKPFMPDFNALNGNNNSNTKPPEGDQFVFLPDEKTALSFMAGITLIAGTEKAFNSDAVLEVAFNENGGIRYAQFNGTGYFFTGIDAREKSNSATAKPNAPVFASLGMLYDNENDVFHANLKTYLNIANAIKGTGPGSLVGEAVIHIDKKDWYMYIGRPNQMLGVDIARLAVAQSYFMIGTKVEELPLPPVEVRKAFDDIDMTLMRDGAAISAGKGFATGARFQTGFDSKNKLMPFYAALTIGAGADIMLRDYGNAYCAGESGRIGLNGWYASGQAYVFLAGRVGIKVRKTKFDFLSMGLAAVLQAKLPNPTWLKGQLGGYYSVLGGLVKGKFNIGMQIGDECELINPGGEIDDIEIISDIKPDDNSNDVSVFTAAQASFNTAIDTEFTMVDVQDNLNAYRIRFGEFTVKDNGTPLVGKLEWNKTKDVVALRTTKILPPETKLTASAKIYWEKKTANGTWEIMKEEGQTFYESKERQFTTGKAPDFIPDHNVAYTYPVKYQYNLHVKESNQGYVKLNVEQEYLFKTESDDGTRWSYTARFKDTKGTVQDTPLTYDVANKQASFTIPENLATQTLYTLSFIRTPEQSGSVDRNLERGEKTTKAENGNEVSITSNTLQGTVTQSIEKEIYSSAFRTSMYHRFEEKIAALQNTQDLFDVAVGNVAVIGKRGTLPETFDAIELSGTENQNAPLIQLVASKDISWMQDMIGPKIYDAYPVNTDVEIKWRDPQVLGTRPLKGVVLRNDLDTYKLTEANLRAGYAPVKQGNVTLAYFLSYYAYWDYKELSDKAGAIYINNIGSAPAGIKKLLTGGYIDLVQGNYPVEIQYVMPGTGQVTYSNKISIRF